MSNRDAANDLVHLVTSGKLMDAFEKYYDEGVVMQENRKEPMVGKDANRARELWRGIIGVRGMAGPRWRRTTLSCLAVRILTYSCNGAELVFGAVLRGGGLPCGTRFRHQSAR